MKIKKKSKTSCVGVLSGLAALSLVATAMVFPQVDGAFAATDCTTTAEGQQEPPVSCTSENITVNFTVNELGEDVLTTGNLNVQFNVGSFIQISQDPEAIPLAVESPDVNGTTAAGKTQFAVRTNSANGFAVTLTTQDNDTQLKPNIDVPNKINAITTSSALSGFGKNTWGVAVTNHDETVATSYSGNYQGMTQSGVSYKKDGFSKEAVPLDLYFGTKVDNTLPSATYGTTVVVSATLTASDVAGNL